MQYRVYDRPTNGTTGQEVGIFNLEDLPTRLAKAVQASPEAGKWILPALSEGETGDSLHDLETVIEAKP